MEKFIFFAVMLSLLISACEMDGFLFKPESLEKYELPGNTIAEENLEQVQFKSEGYTLYGYWVKARTPERVKTILYCHGNKINIDEYWDRVMFLYDLNVNIFIFDYRGYDKSEGETSEAGLYKDGEAALEFVRSQYGIPPDSLILYGYSLGNVVSIFLAAEKVDPICLFAESAFASANSLTQSALALDFPARWLTEGEFNNAEKIKQIKTPFMLLHGADDDHVRYRDNGRIIYENAPQPKKQIVVQGADHKNVPQKMGLDVYRTVLKEWIDLYSE
ncbi:alpha/beta hydrolase [candidate division KSB1 bacterium]|nr:alpha/beta hydrolase [candidate division KSB1 bacterium]